MIEALYHRKAVPVRRFIKKQPEQDNHTEQATQQKSGRGTLNILLSHRIGIRPFGSSRYCGLNPGHSCKSMDTEKTRRTEGSRHGY